jgi:ubiquinone/menaquinone biosynthesis C-methylase UbiE
MSTSTSPPVHVPEKTFKSYTKDQGAAYAKNRTAYHPKLYATILDHHTSTGGQLSTLMDVGCGPGTACRALAPSFIHAFGVDPSSGMINSALSLGGVTSTSEPIRFEIASSEELTKVAENESVDLITAATAAHWFNMPLFWVQAARVLKPGGTVALWASGQIGIHPSVPNAAAIRGFMEEINEKELKPFMEPGNLLTRELYTTLPLPWTLAEPVEEFEEKSFYRKEYGEDSEEFIEREGRIVDLDTMEKVMGTISPVQRWRDAHPDEVGTERDVVRRMRRELKRLLHEGGVEEGKEGVRVSFKAVLLMVKMKA